MNTSDFLVIDISPIGQRVKNYSPDEFFKSRKRAPSAYGGSMSGAAQNYVDMKNYMPVSKLSKQNNITQSVLRCQTQHVASDVPFKHKTQKMYMEELTGRNRSGRSGGFRNQVLSPPSMGSSRKKMVRALIPDDIVLAKSPSTNQVNKFDQFSSSKTLRPFST